MTFPPSLAHHGWQSSKCRARTLSNSDSYPTQLRTTPPARQRRSTPSSSTSRCNVNLDRCFPRSKAASCNVDLHKARVGSVLLRSAPVPRYTLGLRLLRVRPCSFDGTSTDAFASLARRLRTSSRSAPAPRCTEDRERGRQEGAWWLAARGS